jgi:drug/metabolite transporter (DMT)-like permease
MGALSGASSSRIDLSDRARVWAAFAAIYVIWGSTYLAIALGLRAIPPLLLMGARSVLGGVILLGIDRLQGTGPLPKGVWRPAILGGLLLFVGCHGTLAYVQQHLPSGVAAVVLATVPFWLVLLNFLVPGGERRSPWALVGLIPGLLGVALIAWGSVTPSGAALSPFLVVALLASALSWAAGTLVSQRLADRAPAILLAGLQLVCGGVVLSLLGALDGEFARLSLHQIGGASWFGLGYLAIAGSVVAFTAYLWLLERVSAPLVATYTFVNPIIAVVLGWALLGEPLTGRMLLGSTLVVGSVIAMWHFSPHQISGVKRQRTRRA